MADLVTLEQVKQHLNITDTTEDAELSSFIAAVTAVVERHTGQVMLQRSFTERHTVTGRDSVIVLRNFPVESVTSVASTDGSQVWNAGLLDLDTTTGVLRSGSGAKLAGTVEVTYVAGPPVVPPNVQLAALIIVAHLWQTQRVPTFGSAPGFGGGDISPTPSGLGYAIPNRAVELLGGRPPVIA